MTQGELPVGQEARHPHLPLARQVRSGRRMPGRGFGAPRRYGDHASHGRALQDDVLSLRAMHAARTPVLGVDPALVVVMSFNRPPDESALSAAKLHVLEWFDDRVVLAAPDDESLTAFTERVTQYESGPREGRVETAPVAQDGLAIAQQPSSKSAPHENFLDRVDGLRPYMPDDVPTEALTSALAAAASETTVLRVDIQCWCPDNERVARDQLESVMRAVSRGGGAVLDSTLRHRAGLSLIRAEVQAGLCERLFSVSHVRSIDVLPRPDLTVREVFGANIESLPAVIGPTDDAPTIAVIDSGVRSSHPLISAAFVGQVGIGTLDDDGDEEGHGTFVASLALYGPLEPLLRDAEPIRAAARLFSVKVLDSTASFPLGTLWESDLLSAVELAIDQGAQIVNISLGDSRRPYRSSRPTALASALDDIARRRNVVLVISAGNRRPDSASLEAAQGYTVQLLNDSTAGLLDPSTSALALTVGALCGDDTQGMREVREQIDCVPIGTMNAPSPWTRVGPGAARMIKPDVAMPGGGASFDTMSNRVMQTRDTSVVGAEGVRAERLFRLDAGTSFAAPLVAHAAARVWASNPAYTANTVRALVLASSTPVPSVFDRPDSGDARKAMHRLVGFGRPDASRADSSSDHRAVLVATDELPIDSVHLYRVPLPLSFFESGGTRKIGVALAHDPEVRASRLDHMSCTMSFHAFHGVGLDEVANAFLQAIKDEEATEEAESDSENAGDAAVPLAIRSRLLKLLPADTWRARGANQFACIERRVRFDRDKGEEIVLAIRCVNKWAPSGARQGYSVAVVMERDTQHTAVYADLRVRLEQQARVEAELEAEASM